MTSGSFTHRLIHHERVHKYIIKMLETSQGSYFHSFLPAGSISAAFSSPVCIPPRECNSGGGGCFPKQRLVKGNELNSCVKQFPGQTCHYAEFLHSKELYLFGDAKTLTSLMACSEGSFFIKDINRGFGICFM